MTNKTKTPHPKKTHSTKPSQPNQLKVVDHARVDPSHCLADGLFRPLFRGSQSSEPLNIEYEFEQLVENSYKKFVLRWSGPELLSIVDQSVFLAIHRLASQIGRPERVEPHHSNPAFVTTRAALNMSYRARDSECLVLNTTPTEIAETIGIAANGEALQRMKKSLHRLSKVSLSIYSRDDPNTLLWQSNLVSALIYNRKLLIGLNPRLSKAIVATPVTFIDMREQRALQGDITKRLHVWLSCWQGINSTKERNIDIDKLTLHVWGDVSTDDVLYTRRCSLKKSLSEINRLTGWKCILTANGSVYVTRSPPKIDEAVVRTQTTDVTDRNP